MCQFEFDKDELLTRFGEPARQVLREANLIAAKDQDGFVHNDEHRFAVVGMGKPLCARHSCQI